jgi:small subunit ribosomal protein S5
MAKPHSKHGPSREAKEFEEEVLQIDRVTRVVKGGRRLRFRATVIIGDRKGRVGVGVGKSEEVVGAIKKAISDAKKNLITVKLDGKTIPHEVKIKYKSAQILLLPASPGTGIIAGGAIRKIIDLVGISDLLSKSFGTTNKISCSRATILALKSLRETPFTQKATYSEKKAPKSENRFDKKKKFGNKPGNRPGNRPGPDNKPVAKPTEAPKPAEAPEAKPEAKPAEEAPKPAETPEAKPEAKPEEAPKKESN